MKTIPMTSEVAVVRVDFSDDDAWTRICDVIAEPVPYADGIDFKANVEFVDDRDFDGLDKDQVAALNPEESDHPIVLVVDAETITHPENPVLCIDLVEEPGRAFRFVPGESWSVENNLSLANADFEDFLGICDADGIFRGIKEG